MVIPNAGRTGTYQHYTRLLLILIIALTGCSADSGSGNGDNSTSGSVSFNLAWNGVQSQKSVILVTGNPCSDYNILWIHYQAIDQDGNVQSSGKWLCADREGLISRLPWGTYSIIIQGEVSGEITWRGEISGIEVTDNEPTVAGTIKMVHLYDHEAPNVIDTLPADNALGVPVNSAITARFDEAIVDESITVDNFTLTYPDQSGGENRVACTARYDQGNRIAVLTPITELLNNTTYTATIAVDQDIVVEDMAGNPIQQAKQWTFTTFRPDEEAPYVQTRSPQHGDMDIELNALVLIQFSEAINSETISTDSIYMQHNDAVIQCDLRYDRDENMVTLDPVNDLPPGSTCDVFVTTAITDISGNSLESTEQWSFVTQFPSWHIESINGAHTQMSPTQITLESNDTVHISIWNQDYQIVDIVRTPENTWDTVTLAGEPVSRYQDMVIDSGDIKYWVYFVEESQQLKACYKSGSLIPPCADVDSEFDLKGVSLAAVDNVEVRDRASICYYDATDAQLKYAAEASGWSVEIIDTGGGEYPSIAVESTGAAHISYYDTVNNHLKYATNISGSWVTEAVDLSENVGRYTAIALDASGNPHISYRDDHTESLKYAAKQPSSGWLIETVDDSGVADTGIALDSLGLAHISYISHSGGTSNNALKYATKTALGRWHTQIVDDMESGITGSLSSIIIDSQDHIHISYGHSIPSVIVEQLKYATTRPQN